MKKDKQHQTTGTGENTPVDEELTEAVQTDAESAAPNSGADENREAQLEAELEDLKDRYLRLYSQYEEYKKQMQKEQAKRAQYAGEEILRGILPVLDNLKSAIDVIGQGIDCTQEGQLTGLLKGVDLTYKGLLDTLERFGVTPIDSIGRPYNPEEQEAMAMQASSEMPSGYVLAEYKRGYRYKDRLLRPAQVVVSSGPKS